MSLALALVSGFAAVAGSIALQLRLRGIRKKRLTELELRPNCLLTRHPIVFVASPRSVFRLFEPWNDIPGFLREHGYEVMVLEAPSKGGLVPATLKTLEALEGKHHLIGDSSLEPEFTELALRRHTKIATLTLAKNSRAESSRVQRKSAGQSASRPPTLDDLKPLPSTLETLDIGALVPNSLPRTWINLMSLTLLSAHNAFRFGRRKKIDALEIGQFLSRSWVIESRFLDLAISLAERDAQWSD